MGSIPVGKLGSALAALLASALLFLVFAVCPVFAAGEAPWWHVVASTAPTNLPPGGVGKVLVTATNLGDAGADPSVAPVVVSDRLPAGIEAIGITSQAGPLGVWSSSEESKGECSLERVSCTFHAFSSSSGSLPAFADVELALTVRVTAGAKSGGVNEAVVEGGGSARDTRTQAFTVDGAATGFGVELFEMVPEGVGGAPDTQAGSHPFQLTTTIDLNQNLEGGNVESPELVRDLRVHLPAGLVGNPTPFPQCTAAQFAEVIGSANACPANTVVGVAKVTFAFGANPFAIPVPLFSLTPDHGEPARFGFVAVGDPVILDTAVRTGGDYGVIVNVHNITQAVDLLSSQVTFWGDPFNPRHDQQRGWHCLDEALFVGGACEPAGVANAQPLLTLPTSCALPWAPTVFGDSWKEPAAQQSAEYHLHDRYGVPLGLSGCNKLTFEPSISVAPDGRAGSTPTGLTVGIHVPQTAGLNPEGDAAATVKNTTVALPAGVTLNPAAADGLSSCSTEQVGLQSAAPVGCPESAKVGTVEIHTPLLPDPLVGAAYLAAQDANPFGSLVALYIVAEDAKAGVLVKLAGEVKPDPVTGQLVSTFKETPQLPFEDLSLHFFGGSRAPLGHPRAVWCLHDDRVDRAVVGSTPQNRLLVDSRSRPGRTASPCCNPLPFAPCLTTGSLNLQAGAFTPLTTTMSRKTASRRCRASSCTSRRACRVCSQVSRCAGKRRPTKGPAGRTA